MSKKRPKATKRKTEGVFDPYDRSPIPQAVLEAATALLEEARRDTLLCGTSFVVEGWWIESHTLGCRNAADEPEEDWWSSHWEILDRYERNGYSRILFDEDSGVFVTTQPQKRRKVRSP